MFTPSPIALAMISIGGQTRGVGEVHAGVRPSVEAADMGRHGRRRVGRRRHANASQSPDVTLPKLVAPEERHIADPFVEPESG